MGGGYALYYSRDLKIKDYDDVFIVGDITSVTETCLEEYLNQYKEGNISIEDILFYMCGRYAAICDGNIYMDFAGFMGLYYYQDDTNWMISNDLQAFCEYFNLEVVDLDFSSKKWFNWMPLPLTTVTDVKKLINRCYISFNNNNIEIKDRQIRFRTYSLSKQELSEKLIQANDILFRGLADKYSKISLTLTGGCDSRTTFSLMKHSGISFDTFSFAPNDFSQHDRTTPEKISKICNVNYTFLNCGEYSKEKELEYDNFNCKSMAGADRWLYARNLPYPNEKGTLIVKSGIYEAAIDCWRNTFHLNKDLKKEVRKRFAKLAPNCVGTRIEKSYLEYLDELPDSITIDNFPETFYLEQRSGSWGSYNERGYDLYDCVFLHPCDCGYIFSLWYSFPKRMRTKPDHEKRHQKYVIKQLCPEISKLRYNNNSLYTTAKKILKNTIKRILGW